MKNRNSFLIFALLLNGLSPALSWAQIDAPIDRYVYFLRGGPFDWHSSHYHRMETEIEGLIQGSGMEVRFQSAHNTQSAFLCSRIFNDVRDHGLAQLSLNRVILVGHSWGSSAATGLIRCLERRGVVISLLVSLDLIPRPGDIRPDEIPESVSQIFNFYQDVDPVLKGVQALHRPSGLETNIVNELTPMPSANPVDAHNRMVTRLLELGRIQILIRDELLR